MKKLLVSLIGLSFLANSILLKAEYKFPDHRRNVSCAFSATTFKCDEKLRKEALEWFITVPIDTVIGLMAFVGARPDANQKAQITALQKQKQEEVAALEKTMNRQNALSKMAEQGKLLDLKTYLHFDKWA